jgi:PDZ domain-containing secreted protein
MTVLGLAFMINLCALSPEAYAKGHLQYREQLVPILGVTLDEKPIGTVANLVLSFEERHDHLGLTVFFKGEPGRFSRMAQTAIQQAIYRTARIAGLSTDSWTVALRVPYPGLTVYGESLSAMVGLSVVALAKGEFIPPDRVITGTVTPEGHIAPVGAVALKIVAANEAHMRRVVVPDEMDVADGDWVTPFLVQVSPVRSVTEAYLALTDHPLRPTVH